MGEWNNILYRGMCRPMIIDERWKHRRRRWKMDDRTTMLCGGLCGPSRMTAAVQSVNAGALVKSMIGIIRQLWRRPPAYS